MELDQDKFLENEGNNSAVTNEIEVKENEADLASNSKEEEKEEEDLDNLNENTSFRLKWRFLRRLIHSFFVIENEALNWSGECPSFEREVLFDKCKSCTFSFSRLFWERVFNETRPLNSSIRAKKY